jgi:hypothetical protein
MLLHRSSFILLLAGSIGTSASAQVSSGSCSVGPGFQCSEITARTGNGLDQRHWVRAVILWRFDSTGRVGRRDTAAVREAMQGFRDARRAAEDSGRAFLGGSSNERWWSAAYTQRSFRGASGDSLYVAGKQFAIPLRDSALIVMIEGLNDGIATPAFFATGWMQAALEADYWPKHWTSGDTSFIVRPRRQMEILRAALLGHPEMRNFLQRAP